MNGTLKGGLGGVGGEEKRIKSHLLALFFKGERERVAGTRLPCAIMFSSNRPAHGDFSELSPSVPCVNRPLSWEIGKHGAHNMSDGVSFGPCCYCVFKSCIA